MQHRVQFVEREALNQPIQAAGEAPTPREEVDGRGNAHEDAHRRRYMTRRLVDKEVHTRPDSAYLFESLFWDLPATGHTFRPSLSCSGVGLAPSTRLHRGA